MTTLLQACNEKDIKVVKELLQSNTNDINHVDGDGCTALHIACKQKDLDTIKILLNYNVNVKAKNNKGETPLHILMCDSFHVDIHKFTEMIKVFLKQGADINSIDNEGKTPLANACNSNSLNMVKALRRHDADVHWKDSRGTTLLHLTVKVYDPEIFEYLLKHGADINSLCDNKTAFDLVIEELIKFSHNIDDPYIDCYIHQVDGSIQIYQTARYHIIKLKCAKLNVCKNNYDAIYTDSDFHSNIYIVEEGFDQVSEDKVVLEDQCNKEIEKLKKKNVSCISLYNFLTDSIHDIARFVKNREVIHLLDSPEFEDEFPLYADIMNNRFTEAMVKCRLLETTKKYFFSIICKNLTVECVHEICRYLGVEDLKVFISVLEKVNVYNKRSSWVN